MFGVKGKKEGILDVEDKKDLKRWLEVLKEEFDREERNVFGKDDVYECKFWKYLELNYEMMKNNMVVKVWRRVGLKDGFDGKLVFLYINLLEFMNYVMFSLKKDIVLSENVKDRGLIKFEFIILVFEEIYRK